jgi:hypothetical protein
MKLLCILVALSTLYIPKAVNAQTQPPKVLLQILHCAKTDELDLLSPLLKKDHSLQAAWAHRVRYDPYVDEFFIVLYKSPTKGDILVYSRTLAKGRAEFYLGNNTQFVIDSGDIELTDPLGGLWTRDNIVRNVKRAMRGPTYSIQTSTMIGRVSNVACHSYPH